MTINIHNITFDEICKTLEKEYFYMHYDNSDAMRLIKSEQSFNEVKELLISKYGNDISLHINKDAYWFDNVKIINDAFNHDSDEYTKNKLEWCQKYGSN